MSGSGWGLRRLRRILVGGAVIRPISLSGWLRWFLRGFLLPWRVRGQHVLGGRELLIAADAESDQIDEDRQKYDQQRRTRLHVVLAVWIVSTAIGNRRLPGLLPADKECSGRLMTGSQGALPFEQADTASESETLRVFIPLVEHVQLFVGRR